MLLAVIALPSLACAALDPVPVPVENPITEEKRVLGKILFWDEQLSSDNTVACGSCHLPAAGGGDPRLGQHPGPDGEFGGDDDLIGSPGIARRNENNQPIADLVFGLNTQVTGRASPSFFFGMYADDVFWDGRARSTFVNPLDESEVVIALGGALESQAVGPILSDVEMAHENRDWPQVTEKLQLISPLNLAGDIPSDMAAALRLHPSYPELFADAFGDSEITPVRIAMAIATYERTLVPDQSPWDLYMAGDETAMSEQQILGWEDFQEQTICDNCHVPPLFTDNKFHNIGLRPAEEDNGRQEVTNVSDDFGRFKTPTLRNSGLKSSLMHVGWVTDTQDAIDFYNAVSADTGHTQFINNQSGIPQNNGGADENSTRFTDYSELSMFTPAPSRQLSVIDFIANGLTDPRVATETYPFDRPQLSSERSDAVRLKMMSYNILINGWESTRADVVADVIRTEGADVLGIQEARNQQKDDLSARLSDIYDFYNFEENNFQPILVRKNMFEVLASGSFEEPKFCVIDRFINYLVLEENFTGRQFIFYNSQFCPAQANLPSSEPLSAVEINQSHAAELVKAIVANNIDWQLPVIAVGDLNASLDSDSIQFLIEQQALSDGSENSIQLNDSWDGAFPGVAKLSARSVDWVLFSPAGIAVIDATVVDNEQTAEASDHLPVTATILLQQSSVAIDDNEINEDIVIEDFIYQPGGLEDFIARYGNFSATVQAAYLAYYGRAADPEGLVYWVGRLDASGGDLNEIIQSFGESEEFEERFSDTNVDVLVNNIFQNLFSRDVDDMGLAFYRELLESGTRSLQSIALDILNGAINNDQVMIDNKLLLSEALSVHLDDNEVSLSADELSLILAQAAVDYGVDDVISEGELEDFLASL